MTTWKDGGPNGLRQEIVNKDGSRAICTVWTHQFGKDGVEAWPPGEANFRLILQAPKLLEALEEIAAVKHPQWCDFGAMTKAYNQRGEIARAAIEAAKREQEQ